MNDNQATSRGDTVSVSRCPHCGDPCAEDALVQFGEEQYCEFCLAEETVVCSHCGARVLRLDAHTDTELDLCASCYDRFYTYCGSCERIISTDDTYYLDEDGDDGPYCHSCYTERRDAPIHSYNYKPAPIFYGDTGRHYGVELEIDCGGTSNANARELLSIANRTDELLYIKTDGSLNSGLELVTHPMTLEFHQKCMPWAEISRISLDMGYYSHKANTCGLHIHVDRKSLGNSETAQDDTIGRVLFFVERFWQEMLRFSRRTELQMQQWAARYGFKERPKDLLDHVKKGYGNRYTCVNITGYHTIEFRLFRGTLKYNTLIATLQMVNEICDVAFSMSDDELAKLGWFEFVDGIDNQRYPELVTYLRERRLYLNDPITQTEGEEI